MLVFTAWMLWQGQRMPAPELGPEGSAAGLEAPQRPDSSAAFPSADSRGALARQPDEFVRLPGLFRKWELEQVVQPGDDFHLERAGTASDGTALFAVYRQPGDDSPASHEGEGR